MMRRSVLWTIRRSSMLYAPPSLASVLGATKLSKYENDLEKQGYTSVPTLKGADKGDLRACGMLVADAQKLFDHLHPPPVVPTLTIPDVLGDGDATAFSELQSVVLPSSVPVDSIKSVTLKKGKWYTEANPTLFVLVFAVVH